MSHDIEIERFLRDHGFEAAVRGARSADASFRSYIRLTGGPYPALLMDAPPGREPLQPFIEIAAHLRNLGLSAPKVPAYDLALGLALIEDFGDATYTNCLNAGAAAGDLYARAVDALAAMQSHVRNANIAVPAYDWKFFANETQFFLDWYWPAVRPDLVGAATRASFVDALQSILDPVLAGPTVLVHRDFHVDNLMIVPDRAGVQACGLLDFQDALIGPPAYDLVSLLQDERRDVDPVLADAMRARYAALVPMLADDYAYWALGLQRHLKNLGIFARLSRRDGKHRYLAHIPRMWRLIDLCLARELRLAPMVRWLADHWPPESRFVPACPEDAA
jgi:aminoglycoside/choline kinase family phosphotransferase